MAEQPFEPWDSIPERKVRARIAHLPPKYSDAYNKLPPSEKAKYEEHMYDWLDPVDWMLVIAIAGLSAVASTGHQTGLEAALVTFPGLTIVFAGYNIFLKVMLSHFIPPAGQEVVSKIVGALSAGLFGILITKLFS
jgi:hypothetical protein